MGPRTSPNPKGVPWDNSQRAFRGILHGEPVFSQAELATFSLQARCQNRCRANTAHPQRAFCGILSQRACFQAELGGNLFPAGALPEANRDETPERFLSRSIGFMVQGLETNPATYTLRGTPEGFLSRSTHGVSGEGRRGSLVAVSFYDKHSVGPSTRPICTTCFFEMTNMIQVCRNLHRAGVFIVNARPHQTAVERTRHI